MLSVQTQKKLTNFFRQLADLELQVEQARQDLANLYDFEPYAAFQRVDMDGNGKMYVMDLYEFLHENGKTHICIKDIQLLVQFYDLDNSGSIEYNEFMKFVLPCDNQILREQVCLRKTYKLDFLHGERLHESVENALSNFFEKEINIHIKIEMLKAQILKTPDWDSKAAFKLLDSQNQNFISHFNLYGFLNQNDYDASDEELIAIIRRIEGAGNGQVEENEFEQCFQPIYLKTHDIRLVEEEGISLAEKKKKDQQETRPFLQKLTETKPISAQNPVEMNLKLYDQYKQLERGEYPEDIALVGMYTPEKNASKSVSAFKGRDQNVSNFKLQQSNNASPFQNARGTPIADASSVHPGQIIISNGQKISVGPLNLEDEREMVQVMYEMILVEQEIEEQKQKLSEQGDFNLVDAFSMMDEKNLGWISAPQIYYHLLEQGVFAHKDDVYSFTRRFDRDSDSKLIYADFCEAFTPKDTYYQHALAQRPARYVHNKQIDKKKYFTDQTRDLFYQTFKRYFQCDQKIELSKKKLSRKPSFNVHDAFSALDCFRQGHLNRDDLKRIMQRNGFHSTESELTWLTARFDRRLSGIITYQDFMDEILVKPSLLGQSCYMNLIRILGK